VCCHFVAERWHFADPKHLDVRPQIRAIPARTVGQFGSGSEVEVQPIGQVRSETSVLSVELRGPLNINELRRICLPKRHMIPQVIPEALLVHCRSREFD
jgi:hypothetical protein